MDEFYTEPTEAESIQVDDEILYNGERYEVYAVGEEDMGDSEPMVVLSVECLTSTEGEDEIYLCRFDEIPVVYS